MTLEELQAENLKLADNLKNITQERDTLKTTVDTQTAEISSLKEHNQKLFLRCTAPAKEEPNDEKTLSIVEVAGEILKGGKK